MGGSEQTTPLPNLLECKVWLGGYSDMRLQFVS